MHLQWLKFSRLWLSTICLGLLTVIGCAVPIILEPAATANSTASAPEALAQLEAVNLGLDERLQVVASTNIVADVVAQVGGEHVDLVELMPIGADPHSFQPTPQDLIALNSAHAIFINGLNLEESLTPILESLDGHGAIVSVNAGVETIEFGGDGHDHDEQPEAVASERRLLISSMDEGLVEVVDPLSGEVIERLALTGPARLYPTENQRFAVAVQTDNDQINVIDGGLWTEDHGDHLHDYEETPSLLDAAMTGERPIHFVAHGGTVAIFFDGEGTTQLIQQRELEDADAELATLDSSAPHHGVAVPLGDQVLLSMPGTESDSALPIGMAVYSLSGELLQEFPDCPGLHGEAALGDAVHFSVANQHGDERWPMAASTLSSIG